jgi:hypothetical protein
MIKTGNLFELAEKQLLLEGEKYTAIDVIEYAIKMRKWLDKSTNIKKLKKLIIKEKANHKKELDASYNLVRKK